MSDLIERLRDADIHSQQRVLGSRIFGEAADRIEALEKENAWLKLAMTPIALVAQAAGTMWLDTETVDRLPHVGSILKLGYLRNVAAALRDAKERKE